MMFSDAIIGRHRANHAWWRSTAPSMKATSSFMSLAREPARRINTLSRALEAVDVPVDDAFRHLVDLLEFLVDERFRVALDRAEVRPLLRDDLGRRRLRLVDRVPNLGDDADPDLLHLALVLADEAVGDVEREEIVQLAHVVYGIIARGGLHRLLPLWCYESADAAHALDAAVIPVLTRAVGDRQLENPRIVVVARVDVDLHCAVREL